MIFRQFSTADKEISYLLADPVTRQAALLDPNLLAEESYMQIIEQLDLTLVHVMETHVHEIQPGPTVRLCELTGARLVSSDAGRQDGTDLQVGDGDNVFVGEELISVLATPGYSACSLSYYWRDRVFTGHTLLAGATGSCQRLDADAGDLFDSVREKLFSLPNETLVYPGQKNTERCLSSIGQERTLNKEMTTRMTREIFIQRKQREAMNCS